jgi:DNA polymerase-3 subunit gamma/tau
MSSLYVTYRPTDLDGIIGNEAVVTSLAEIIKREKDEIKPHAILIHGPSGCGKTTLGRILAEGLGCKGMDLTEVDTGDFRGIDTIRDIRSRMYLKPMEGSGRGWIIDECARLTPDAQSALLKSLEDTPPAVTFILCTTDPDKLLPTIRNRCTQFQVSLLNEREITIIIRTVAKKEGIEISVDSMKKIAKASQGSPRQALVLLDKCREVTEDQIDSVLSDVFLAEAKVIDLCRILISKSKDWVKVCEILERLKNENPESVRRAVIGYFAVVLTKDPSPHYGAYWTMRCFYRSPTYDLGFTAIKLACFEAMFIVSDEKEQ